jgi:hypothetical protein
MKPLKPIGLSLLAVLALGASAASASAEEGFLPTPKTAAILGGEAILETTSKAKISCTKSDEVTVTFTNDKTSTATLLFLGCVSGGFQVETETSDSSGIILVPVKFLVCLDPKSATGGLLDEYGIAAEVEGTLKILQPATGVKISVLRTALSAILTLGEGKLFSVEFLGKEGKQTVTECLQGTTKIKHTLEASFNGGAFEAASLNVVGGLMQFSTAVKLEDS